MVYALCFDTNTVFCFCSEREAADYCRHHAGDWQLCDEAGRTLLPIGFAPQARMGLLAAHLWLTHAHSDDAYSHDWGGAMVMHGHHHHWG